MSDLRFCPDAGSVITSEGIMPTDPSEPAPELSLRSVGCNQMWCHRCDVAVRQQPNTLITGEPVEGAAAILYWRQDWSTLDWIYTGGRVARLYCCPCSVFTCTQAIPVDKGPDAEWYEHRVNLPPWRCHGHPSPDTD